MRTDPQHILAIPETDVIVFSGDIIATDVAYGDYLSGDYGSHTEWLFGVVIAMSPICEVHAALTRFLAALFETCLELTGGGRVLQEPMVMRPNENLPGRQPDIQVLLPERMSYLKKTEVAGPANLVVEVVSPESIRRDRGEKYAEYEQGGVDEYWILDPQRKDAAFFVRGSDNLFHSRLPVNDVYTSAVLDKLQLRLDLLWREKPPTVREAVKMIEALLSE